MGCCGGLGAVGGGPIGFVVVSMPSETIGEKVRSGQESVTSEPSSAAQTNTPPTDDPMLAPVNPAAGLLAAPVPWLWWL